ncbi:hypothetical protein N657DRAFT_616236 [Parathielavia appendiculata]|uniref:Mitochondrial inner-membrane-bound regulator-domain-containing protein n=1 Tax=Parathielavia appendiculata TaxID=2587402 RepID=A0AAN6Z4T4_9PEZI|nr:hypothetical protein N657DRAFT_616236 [Parathielavia appendiculata]
MLGRKLAGSASFVCFRCRLQLARAPNRSMFPAATSIVQSARPSFQRHINIHSGQGVPIAADKPGSDIDIEISDEPNPDPSAEQENDGASHDGGFGIIPKPSPTTRSPQNRTVYTSRGRLVSPEQEGLSVDILGKPGSAIILREKRALRKSRRHPTLSPNNDPTDGSVDPASLLSNEDTFATSDDILLNIHELKPNGTRILSDKDFNKLQDTLVQGFTNAQLVHYIGEYQRIRRLSQEDEHVSEVHPWVLEAQPWVPYVAGAGGAVEPLLQGYVTKVMTPKKRLAIRILRECWDVSNREVLDRDGYLEIRLRDAEFSLLTLGNRRWLEGTPRAILDRVKQVKLIRESRLVSIVGPKHAAESILDRIHDVLSKARTSDFPVDLVSPNPLELSILEEVGRMTNTLTRLDSSGNKVVVTWIHLAQRDENLENASETVFRFLRDAYGPKPRVSTALSVVPDHLVHRGRYLPMLNVAPKLPWEERFGKWERWTNAIPQSKAAYKEQTLEASIPADILAFDTVAENAIQPSEVPIGDGPGWSSALQTDTTAVFGHVVFARKSQHPPSPDPHLDPTSQLDTSFPRTFVPTLPALGCLNLPSNLREQGLWHTTTMIRFAPSPDMSPDLVISAPTLELRLDADHHEITGLTSLRAIKDTFRGDVLFPAAPVDVRLIQQRYLLLPGPSIERHVPAIVTFLTKSNLRPWEGKLNTPPVLLGIRLPRRILSSSQSDSIPATNPTPTAEESDDVELAYNLAAIEVHRTVTAEYEGLKLRYTSIQAGQRGGERSELSLEAVRIPEEEAAAALESEQAQAKLGEDLDRYQIVDEEMFRAQFESHSMSNTARRQRETTKPAELEEFLRVASSIVNERGWLRWHAKRS